MDVKDTNLYDFLKLHKLLGQNVRHIREKQNITLDVLSQHSGISKQYLIKIENGQACRITTKHLDRLCNTLNVMPCELFYG